MVELEVLDGATSIYYLGTVKLTYVEVYKFQLLLVTLIFFIFYLYSNIKMF